MLQKATTKNSCRFFLFCIGMISKKSCIFATRKLFAWHMRKHGVRIRYDNLWKDIITEFLPEFILFFLPKLYLDIDWNQTPVFLEQELHDIVKAKYPHKKITDKLVKVFLTNGSEKWLFVHVEVQSSFEKDFAERMFVYYMLIYQKYGQKITALAIFTHQDTPKHYDYYESNNYDTILRYQYNTYRIKDQTEETLLQSANPFAMAVLANWYVLNTPNDYEKRLHFKQKLFELALERQYRHINVARLLLFIKNLMFLPEYFETIFEEQTQIQQNQHNMLKPTKRDIAWAAGIYEAYSGESIDAVKQEMKLAKKEAAQERKKAEQALKKAEQEQKKAEQEQKKAEQEQKKAEENRATIVIELYSKHQFSTEQIADILKTTTNVVQNIIDNHKL